MVGECAQCLLHSSFNPLWDPPQNNLDVHNLNLTTCIDFIAEYIDKQIPDGQHLHRFREGI